MNIDFFERFIGNIGFMRYFINSIGLTAKGEPMKHPDFMRFCDAIEKAKIKFSITTNGDFLHQSEIDKLLKYKYLTNIRVSIYDRKVYDRLRDFPIISFYNMTGKPIDGVQTGVKLWAEGLTTNTIPKNFNTIKSCQKPFSYLTLNPDGSITPCNSWHELGNGFDTPLYKMWNNKLVRNYRKGALKMCVPDSDCLNCGFNKE